MFTLALLSAVAVASEVNPPLPGQHRKFRSPEEVQNTILSRLIAGTEGDLASSRAALKAIEGENDPTQDYVVDFFRRRVDRLERELKSLRTGNLQPLPPDPPNPNAWRWSPLFREGGDPLRNAIARSVAILGVRMGSVSVPGAALMVPLPTPSEVRAIRAYFVQEAELRLSIVRQTREKVEKQNDPAKAGVLARLKKAETQFQQYIESVKAGDLQAPRPVLGRQ